MDLAGAADGDRMSRAPDARLGFGDPGTSIAGPEPSAWSGDVWSPCGAWHRECGWRGASRKDAKEPRGVAFRSLGLGSFAS